MTSIESLTASSAPIDQQPDAARPPSELGRLRLVESIASAMDLGSLLTQNKPRRIKASSRSLEYRQIAAPNKCKPERSSHIDEDFRTDFAIGLAD